MRIEFLKMELITTARIDFGIKKTYNAHLLTIFCEAALTLFMLLVLGSCV